MVTFLEEEQQRQKPSKDPSKPRKTIRIMMFKGKMETVQPLYEYLNILPLNLNRKLLCAKFMQNLVSKNIL